MHNTYKGHVTACTKKNYGWLYIYRIHNDHAKLTKVSTVKTKAAVIASCVHSATECCVYSNEYDYTHWTVSGVLSFKLSTCYVCVKEACKHTDTIFWKHLGRKGHGDIALNVDSCSLGFKEGFCIKNYSYIEL